MLARSAERVYWAGRYLERAENTARVIQQYSQLLLDLPQEVGVGWGELVPIFGLGSSNLQQDDADFAHAMLADMNNGASLYFCLRQARENIRNARDLLPTESWESVNELYIFARDTLPGAISSEDRFEVLSQCIGHCQQVSGCLSNTMSHRSPYQFLMLGLQIERADMTTRIIDIAASYLKKNARLTQRYGSTLWTNLLKTVGGFQMYRQYVQPQVSGERVIEFLVYDESFPRAIGCCLDEAMLCVQKLPNHAIPLEALKQLRASLGESVIDTLEAAAISQMMDSVQQQLDEVHTAVAQTWFLAEAG